MERRGHAWGWWAAAAGCTVASLSAVTKLVADGSSASSVASGLVGFSCALAIGYSTIAAALRTGDPRQRFAFVLLLVAVSRAAFVVSWAWGVAGSPVAAWLAFWLPFVAVALTPLSLLWFPDGSLPDDRRRWRLAQQLVVLGLVGVAALPLLRGTCGARGWCRARTYRRARSWSSGSCSVWGPAVSVLSAASRASLRAGVVRALRQ